MAFPIGKLDARVLAEWVKRIPIPDPRVLVGPRVGEDAAVIAFADTCLVVSTDPVTLATERLGWYAVHVNANDVATMGARPRWFLATLLLPDRGTDRALADGIFTDLLRACEELGVTLCGGHTEVTYGLPRPVVVGQMMGEVPRARLRRLADARPGDRLLLCKGVAIEATSILGRERAAEVVRDFGEEFQRRAREFLDNPGISVVAPALRAAGLAGVRAMHDPTEGGIVTALHEVALAAGTGLRARREAIPIYPECARLCERYRLDPLGAIASGALLIVVAPEAAASVAEALRAAGFPCAQIGTLTANRAERVWEGAAGDAPLPEFATDEIARVLP
jgi:hydrogenase maturation factor